MHTAPSFHIAKIDSGSLRQRPRLAHELVHADRAMRGAVIDNNKTVDYKYQSGWVEKPFIFPSWSWWSPVYTTEKDIKREELATVGLKYVKKGDITENMIRKEQDLYLRGAYK